MNRGIFGLITILALSLFPASQAGAAVLTFDDLTTGEWVTTQYSGVTITTENFRAGHPDKGIIFDTTPPGATADPDLVAPFDGGNIQNETLNNVLIIAENDFDGNGDGFVDSPDDEARRPAGTVEFLFNHLVDRFQFDFIDVDNGGPGRESPADYMVSFYLNNQLRDAIDFGEYALMDPTIIHGDNYANRYPEIFADDVGGAFNRVVVTYGGSGAIDNISYNVVPEPATMMLFSGGLIGAAASRRRKQQKTS